MSISLSSIASAISVGVASAKAVEGAALAVYKVVSPLIAAAETAYDGVENAGGTKKAAVLASAEAVAADVGADWSTIKEDVSSLIDVVKASYNAVKSSVVSPAAPSVSDVAA